MSGEARNLAEDPKVREIVVSLLLERIGNEIQGLARLSISIERALSEIDLHPSLPAETVRDLQTIDRITQTLRDLGRLVPAIAFVLPDHLGFPQTELISQLRLAELIERLDPEIPICTLHREDDGEVAWF
ncbi:hypothetical protein [Thioclava atlantica]|uniref:Uncharacterized protein n=1 Tax=Thioclava atlantica TaxID=1317124 RepID=A0A085TXF7_9RHOB|nr:hypothetical protein [Thioclava atlantica]KFE35404.1 hypothetical protein DW2_08242 [Thioclava atlantica]